MKADGRELDISGCQDRPSGVVFFLCYVVVHMQRETEAGGRLSAMRSPGFSALLLCSTVP